jgi:hypothetical protein
MPLSKNIIEIIVKYRGYDQLLPFTPKFLEENVSSLDWKQISGNFYVPYSFLLKHKDKIVWTELSYKKDIPIEFIEDHLEDIDWNGSMFPEEFIEKHMKTEYKQNIDWNFICERPDLSIEFYEKHLNKLKWTELCKNEKIPLSFFEKYCKHPKYKHKIDWVELSGNKNIPLSFLEQNLSKINWHALNQNPNLTPEFIEKYKNIEWDWTELSSNEGLPISFFQQNLDRLDWQMISANENIPIWFFELHKDKVDYVFLSENNVCYTFFENYLDNKEKEKHYDNKEKEKHYDNIIDEVNNFLKTNNITFKRFITHLNEEVRFNENNNNEDYNILNYISSDEYYNITYDLTYIDALKKYIKVLTKKYIQVCNQYGFFFEDELFLTFIHKKLRETMELLRDGIDYKRLSSNRKLSYKFFEKFLINNDNKKGQEKIVWKNLCDNDMVPLSFLLKCIEHKKITWSDLSSSYRVTYEENIEEMTNILLRIL